MIQKLACYHLIARYPEMINFAVHLHFKFVSNFNQDIYIHIIHLVLNFVSIAELTKCLFICVYFSTGLMIDVKEVICGDPACSPIDTLVTIGKTHQEFRSKASSDETGRWTAREKEKIKRHR